MVEFGHHLPLGHTCRPESVDDPAELGGESFDLGCMLDGCEDDSDVTHGRYGKDFRAGIMADVVAKLTFLEFTVGIRPFAGRR